MSAVDRTVNRGQRSYTANSYLAQSLGRPNLKVLKEATAAKVILENGTAGRVKFSNREQTHEVFVKEEVMVSCGAFKSPRLLNLSGIGKQVTIHGIWPVREAGVRAFR